MLNKFFILLFTFFVLIGCTFGEYADSKDTTTSSNGNYVKFSEKKLKDKSLYKVYKIENKWAMSRYDFNGTNFKTKALLNTNFNQSGTYKITTEGYLKLINIDIVWYIKALKEDSEKIYLLWTIKKDDLSKTSPTKDTYFFKNKNEADQFIKPNSTTTENPAKPTKNSSSAQNIIPIINYILL